MASTDSTAVPAPNDQDTQSLSYQSSDQSITQPLSVPPSSPQDSIIGAGGAADGNVSDSGTEHFSDGESRDNAALVVHNSEPGSGGRLAALDATVKKVQILPVSQIKVDSDDPFRFYVYVNCEACGPDCLFRIYKSSCIYDIDNHNESPEHLKFLRLLHCPKHGFTFKPSLGNWIRSGRIIETISSGIDSGAGGEEAAAGGAAAGGAAGGAAAAGGGAAASEVGAGTVVEQIVISDDDEPTEWLAPPILTAYVESIEHDKTKTDNAFKIIFWCPLCGGKHSIYKDEREFNPYSLVYKLGSPGQLSSVTKCGRNYVTVTLKLDFKAWQLNSLQVDPPTVMVKDVLVAPCGMTYAVFPCYFCKKDHAYSIGVVVNVDLSVLHKDNPRNIVGTPALVCSLKANKPMRVKLSLEKWRGKHSLEIPVDSHGKPKKNVVTDFTGGIPLEKVEHEEEREDLAYFYYCEKIMEDKKAAGGGAANDEAAGGGGGAATDSDCGAAGGSSSPASRHTLDSRKRSREEEETRGL